MWNVILYSVEKNKLVNPKNNPKKSGLYVCTCITKIDDNEYFRYLRVMEYEVDKNYWHDIGNKYGISHNILAWKEEEVCDFNDFIYLAGKLLENTIENKGELANDK